MFLCKKIGDEFAECMVDNGLIPLEDQESYSYCVEYALDLVVFNGSLLILGAMLHHFWISLIYLLSLVPLKMMAGGAHASSRKICSLLSYGVFFIVLALSNIVVFNNYILNVILFSTLIGVVILTPVEHPNQSFSLAQKKRLRKFAMVYSFFLFALGMFMLKFFQLKYCVTIVLCVLVVLVNQIIGIMIYKNRRIIHDAECSHL